MVSWSRSQKKNEPRDVEENQSIGDRQEIDADVEEDHDGAFVTGTSRTRGYPFAKILSFTVFALVFAGTALWTGYGISSAVGRSGISPAAVVGGADERTLAESYSPTSYMPTYAPTYAPSAVEEAVVTPSPSADSSPEPKPTPESTEVTVEEATEPAPSCRYWCLGNASSWLQKCTWKNCGGCGQCTMPQVIRDVTADLNPSYNNWDGDDMAHSFGIGSNHMPPSFTDWDGDGSLDLFFNNHYKADFAADFDLGVSRLKNGTPSALQIEFLSIGIETFVDGDSKQMNHDCHGSTFADIDGDGILDLLISVGGGWGAGVGGIHDNMLFWGEETSEGDFRLVGGREAATAAGVQCSNCRGRYMLVTDANRDGKLDIFPVSDNRVDDIQTPTPLLLNNDDKTFTEHPSFYEFTRTILLTDADGDGYAQEYMVFRATCFRDPSEFDHSIWPHNEFCETRPEKTTAIYKYDDAIGEMVLISPEYRRTLVDQQYTPWNKESAFDAVSGDFDGDQKADQIVLFADKMVFYYSSDRIEGGLPLYNEEINQVGSFEMNIPCSVRGISLRLVDLDMDGKMELLLLCSELGEIYLYSQTDQKQEWNLNTSWNLGDLTQTTGWGPTSAQVALACDGTLNRDEYPKYWSPVCRNPNYAPEFYGFQVVDLNNDGFLDFVLSSSVGKHRFFANDPVTVAQNRFLVFELKSTVSNVYAIGATLIFNASGLKPQLREISSFGFGNGRTGGRDDRLVFGFGATAMPESLTVRWPSMEEEVYDLTSVDALHFSDYSNPVIITEPVTPSPSADSSPEPKPTPELTEVTEPAPSCKYWCLGNASSWLQKCTWKNCGGCEPCTPWKFVVFADLHSMSAFSYIDDPADAQNTNKWSDLSAILQNIKDTYGGEVIVMPGDMVSYGGQRTEKIKANYGRPDLTDNEVIYQITRNAARNARYLFDQSGWNDIPLLACMGDHELGGNKGFFTGGNSKIPTIPDYRRGFKEGYNFKDGGKSALSSNPYWYGTTVVNLSTPSSPVGTPYEGTSFAYVHRNALFVTVDAFSKISDSNYLDREKGTGGEGTVTCTVTGAHLKWFESVLSAAHANPSIQHIFVQAHVPIQQPVRKVRCSGQYFDLGVESPFWKAMEKYGVDVYFAGEVHSNTATKAAASGLVQLVTRSNGLYGFLTLELSEDIIEIMYMREVGNLPKFNNVYAEGGRLTIDKTGTSPIISGSGELEIHDLSKPIIAFDFENVHNLGDREIVGHRGSNSLKGTSVDIQSFLATQSFHNKGVYGSHYDAPMYNVALTPSEHPTLGMAGKFDGSTSQMAVYATGPYSGGEPMSFSMWFKTDRESAEMVLFNYGSSWDTVKIGNQKDLFMLTLDYGVPAVRIQSTRRIKVSNSKMNLADGNWHQIAVSMPSKRCLLSEVEIYVDKGRENTVLQGKDLNIFTHTAGRMSLGGVGFYSRGYANTYPNIDQFTGLLDDFRLWAKPFLPPELTGGVAENHG